MAESGNNIHQNNNNITSTPGDYIYWRQIINTDIDKKVIETNQEFLFPNAQPVSDFIRKGFIITNTKDTYYAFCEQGDITAFTVLQNNTMDNVEFTDLNYETSRKNSSSSNEVFVKKGTPIINTLKKIINFPNKRSEKGSYESINSLDSIDKEFTNKIKGLTKQNKILNDELEIRKDNIKNLEEIIKTNISIMKDENVKNSNEITFWRDSYDECFEKLTNNDEQLASMEMKIEGLMNQNAELNTKLENTNSYEQLCSMKSKYEGLKKQNENIQLENTKLILENKQLQEMKMKYNKIKNEKEILDVENKELNIVLKKYEHLQERINKIEQSEKNIVISEKKVTKMETELKKAIKTISADKNPTRQVTPKREKGNDQATNQYCNSVTSYDERYSNSDSEDSYFCREKKKKNRRRASYVHQQNISRRPTPRPVTPNIEANSDQSSNNNTNELKMILDTFEKTVQNERNAQYVQTISGLNAMQENFDKMLSKSNLQHSIASVNKTLTATDIRLPQGQGLTIINQWITLVERANQDEAARKDIFLRKTEQNVVTLLGGDKECAKLTWDDIKKKLRAKITESDPIEKVIELRKFVWTGEQDPLAFATILKDKYETASSNEKLPKSFEEILILNLVEKMNPYNKETWKDLLKREHDNTINRLCKAWNNKGRAYLFDSKEIIKSSLQKNILDEGMVNTLQYNISTSTDNDNKKVQNIVENKTQTGNDYMFVPNTYGYPQHVWQNAPIYPGGSMPFPTMGAYGCSQLPINTIQNKPPQKQPYRNQNKEGQQHPYRPQNRQEYRPPNNKRELRRESRKNWSDWICYHCGDRNQCLYYACNKCGKESQKHQKPKESWQCRHTTCKLSKNIWERDRWCIGCGNPNPVFPELYPREPGMGFYVYPRAKRGEYTETKNVIEPRDNQ